MRIRYMRLPRALVRTLMKNKIRKLILIQAVILVWMLYEMTPLIFVEDDDTLLMYQPPPQSGVPERGKRLNVSRRFWKRKSVEYLNLTAELAKDFVIVTAGSASFYSNNLPSISTVQKFLPGHPLFFYDLEERDKVNEDIAQKFNALCGVTYRLFNFSLYPDHVRNLRYYSWKPLIIYEMLTEFPGVLWIDSSIRFTTNNFTKIFHRAVESDGMLALTSTGHSNFAVTHPQMYSFLPTSKDGMIKTDQHEANCVLLYRTRAAFEGVVYWWMLCALDPLCIAPTDRTLCTRPYASRRVHANCHRFDQSALNILWANYFAFDYMRYFGSANVAVVHRYPENVDADLMVCRRGMNRTAEGLINYMYMIRRRITPKPTLSVKSQKAIRTVVGSQKNVYSTVKL